MQHKHDLSPPSLRLPEARILSKEQAALYLGIGVTLLAELAVPFVKFGRRCVYDRIDLDAWLEEYKHRGRAGKASGSKWPVKAASTSDGTPVTGGSMSYCPTADTYAEALRPRARKKLKPSLVG